MSGHKDSADARRAAARVSADLRSGYDSDWWEVLKPNKAAIRKNLWQGALSVTRQDGSVLQKLATTMVDFDPRFEITQEPRKGKPR